NPEVAFGNTLDDDLIRSDFKVNAMAIELRADGTREFFDPMHGLKDLQAGIMDTRDAAELSFRADPLRMLRAARFVSQLEFRVSDRVRQAMVDMAEEIRRITVERIQVEMDKLILGVAPFDGIDLLVETGLAQIIFPEIPAMAMEPDE